MDNALDKIKQAWRDQPLQVIALGGIVATAAAKILSASTEARNAKTWRKEVERRRMNTLR